MIKVSCKNCGHIIIARSTHLAQLLLCAKCKKYTNVPSKEKFEEAEVILSQTTEDTHPQETSEALVKAEVEGGAKQCKNHPDVLAVDRCTGCAEAFCSNCLVEIQGQKYCGSCKVMAVEGAPVVEEATLPCKEASDALTYSIVGLFCFGIILEPIAIFKALKAKKLIAANPRLTGSGKATAALIIGIVLFLLWVIGLLAKLVETS